MRLSAVRSTWSVVMVLAALAAAPVASAAQSLDGTGAVATGLLLRQMDGVKRVLMIAAHPDDEDTSLLTALARDWGAETAYLSLTRGDGGQNVIGPELWEGLGVVRTGELMAARELDGAEQYFTRAFDYGFSKTADEALTLWPREELLRDVVWVVRSFRPHVIVSVFSGTPRDGHGQHQAAGIMAREAFAAAGDRTRFPEQLVAGLEAWQPAKLYESRRGGFGGRGGGPEPASVTIPTGDLDPLLGRSVFQLSMESRSQHRSQDMGSAQPAGPRSTGVVLVESLVDGGDGFFAGIDTTLVGLVSSLTSAAAETTRGHLEAYRDAVARARANVGLDPVGIADELAEALDHLESAILAANRGGSAEVLRALAAKREVARRAFMAAAGIAFDVRADDDLVVPGQTVRVTAELWNGSPFELTGVYMDLAGVGAAVDSEGLEADGTVAPRTLATVTYEVRIAEDAQASSLYFLRLPRNGAMYRWPADDRGLWGLPRDPERVAVNVDFRAAVAGVEPSIEFTAPWRYVGVDPTRGEFERRVLVVPAVSVSVAPAGLVWPSSRDQAQTVSVVLRSEADGGSRGEVAMTAPAGWTVTPPSRAFALPEAGTERTVAFELRPSGAPVPGEHVFTVEARTEDGGVYTEGYTLIDYEHIERAALFEPAEARATVVSVTVPEGLSVAYIMGSGDDGPAAIRQLGVDVTLLGPDDVRAGAFDDFNTVVLGIRAYETREDLRAASEQLLDFAADGGVVVAQYNRAPLGSLPPYPLDVGRGSPRVTDETAPVTLLDPEAPVFTTPNRIGPADFEGWVQERGLYFGSEWADGWVPLLEMNDAGEDPHRGSLLVASVGDGVFVYTGLSFFRQWASRVPGAYRLFANLISLRPEAWRAYEQAR